MNNAALRRWMPLVRTSLEVLLVLFFLAYAFLHRAQVMEIARHLSIVALAGCIAIYSLSHFWASASTTRLLATLGEPQGFRVILAIHVNRLPAKYLPGGIWHTVGRGADLVARGIDRTTVTRVLLLEQVLALWWSGMLGLALGSVAFLQARRTFAALTVAWVVVGVAGFLLVRRRLPALASAASRPDVMLVYIGGWGCLATAFAVFIALGHLVDASILRVVASYLVSWLVGAIAFFSPQGLGVFEVSVGRLLQAPRLSQAELVWYIGSYRFVVLAADLAAWGCGRALATRRKAPDEARQ